MSVREHDLERDDCPCGGEHFYADHPGGEREDAPDDEGAGFRRARTLLSPSWFGVYLCVAVWGVLFWIALGGPL